MKAKVKLVLGSTLYFILSGLSSYYLADGFDNNFIGIIGFLLIYAKYLQLAVGCYKGVRERSELRNYGRALVGLLFISILCSTLKNSDIDIWVRIVIFVLLGVRLWYDLGWGASVESNFRYYMKRLRVLICYGITLAVLFVLVGQSVEIRKNRELANANGGGLSSILGGISEEADKGSDSSSNKEDNSSNKTNSSLGKENSSNEKEEQFVNGYTFISLDDCNLSGSRKANVVVDIGYGDRDYWAYTNEYGQLVRVVASKITLQDDSNESVKSNGRYCNDEAKVPGTERSDLDEGHVIADSLGGVSNAYNITPQNSTINRTGKQASMEKAIRNAGGCTDFEAIITYPNTSTQIPSHYSYTYNISGVQHNVEFDNAK